MKTVFTFCLPLAFLIGLSALPNSADARGFGGFHGGGGFGGGGFHGGGFGGGGFNRGGFGGGGFGGYRGGGFGGGGFENHSYGGGGEFGGNRFGGDSFGGGNFGGSSFGGYRGGDFGADRFSGYRGGDFDSNRIGGEGLGAGDAGRWGGSVNRSQLNGFLGLPTDAGAHVTAGTFANRGLGNAQGLAQAYGTHSFSATYAHVQGQGVQNWASSHPNWSSAWNSAHPWAWAPAGIAAADWAGSIWNTAAWPAVGTWLGLGAASNYAYDYGDNITYQDGSVYYGSQPAGTADQYYQEASTLASTAPPAPASDAQWLPLGVFGLVVGDSQTPTNTFQLAVDKNGTIRGNSTNAFGDMLPLQGAVDKKTQRVCWTVGTDKTTVYDTGLDNLTKAEAPILVHSGAKTTAQDTLIRMKQPSSTAATSTVSPGNNTAK